MEIQKAQIKDLISPEWNPRQITPEELEKLKTSLDEFGYIDPIIVNDVNNHIVGGNQRYKALKTLGYDEVDVVYVHIEDLNREKACNIALNKISGDWDSDKLSHIFENMKLEGFDITLTGFEEIDLVKDDLYTSIEWFNSDEEENIEDIYTPPEEENDEIICPNCGHKIS